MNWETWEKYKKDLANDNWTAWAKWPDDVRNAMREVEWVHRQYLSLDAVWCKANSDFWIGTAYRVNPAWPGPAKPDPVVEYEDRKVEVSSNGSAYMYTYEIGSCTHKRVLSCAVADPYFAGYVMPDGPLAKCLLFDLQKDGSYRLRVPLAVRLRKEVAK